MGNGKGKGLAAELKTLTDEQASLALIDAATRKLLQRVNDWLDTHVSCEDWPPPLLVTVYRAAGRTLAELYELRRKAIAGYEGDINALSDEQLREEMRRVIEHEITTMSTEELGRLMRLRELTGGSAAH